MAKKTTETNDIQDAISQYLPFILEIRKRVLFLVAIFAVFAAIGFIYYEKIIPFLIGLLDLGDVNIVFTSPFQFISLALNTGMILGSIVIIPLIIFQVLSFLKPALEPKEHRIIAALIPLSLFLFVSGFSFGVVMMRYVILLFYEKSLTLDIGNYLDISLLISQILTTAALMGLAFQFPIVLTLIMKLGIVKYETIAKKRMIAYASSLIFAAFLPPTDLLSLALLTAPLLALFELTLFVNKHFIKPAKIT